MAVDLTIELFSVDLFRTLWYKLGVSKSIPPRFKNYDEISNSNICSEAVCEAILCRRSFFTGVLWSDVYFDYEDYANSGLDFYLYLQSNVRKFLPYEDLNIFDKLFMTCIVVLEMASACVLHSSSVYFYNAPLCYAMYFDSEYKEEFYDKGGWHGLENHATFYRARVLTHNRGVAECTWSTRYAYNDAMNIEYSYDLANRIYKEKILAGRTSCSQCLPQFHIVRMLSGANNDEFIDEFQLAEGYLQLILLMLTHEELRSIERGFLQDSEFDTFAEIIDIGYAYIEAKKKGLSELPNDNRISYKKCIEYLDAYQIQNTYAFLARLFASVEDSNSDVDKCMFCGHDMTKPPKKLLSVSDYQAERIKDIIYKEIHVEPRDGSPKEHSENNGVKNKKKDVHVDEMLQLFFALGVEPVKSCIVNKLKKDAENRNKGKPLNSKMQDQNETKNGIKRTARKKKQNKSKSKN